MNQQMGKQAFEQAENFFKVAFTPESVQAFSQQSVAASKQFYDKTAAIAQDGTKVMAEITDTAWGSTKMLNEKLAQNFAANMETTFAVANKIATAKSLPEIAALQSELLQKLAGQAFEQTKEFMDLSTRASQHLFEKVQATATKSLKPTS